jgi:hypothetical protein
MENRRTTRLLCIADPRGDAAAIAHVLEASRDRDVHGIAAFAPGGHLVVAGMGGAIDDDPDAPREEVGELRYPRWEAEYRLMLGNSLVVAPGSLAVDGCYAVADLQAREVELESVEPAAR